MSLPPGGPQSIAARVQEEISAYKIQREISSGKGRVTRSKSKKA
jgi:hypothetical protein